jgi:hypothetical protein
VKSTHRAFQSFPYSPFIRTDFTPGVIAQQTSYFTVLGPLDADGSTSPHNPKRRPFGGHTFPLRRSNFLGVFQMISKIAFAAALLATSCFGATWTGKISDSACGVSHAKMRAAHTDLTSDKDCTLACIKSGSKYVLVSKGKVFQIDNQNLDDLQKYAGQNVTLTGKLTGDSIEVSSIVGK